MKCLCVHSPLTSKTKFKHVCSFPLHFLIQNLPLPSPLPLHSLFSCFTLPPPHTHTHTTPHCLHTTSTLVETTFNNVSYSLTFPVLIQNLSCQRANFQYHLWGSWSQHYVEVFHVLRRQHAHTLGVFFAFFSSLVPCVLAVENNDSEEGDTLRVFFVFLSTLWPLLASGCAGLLTLSWKHTFLSKDLNTHFCLCEKTAVFSYLSWPSSVFLLVGFCFFSLFF